MPILSLSLSYNCSPLQSTLPGLNSVQDTLEALRDRLGLDLHPSEATIMGNPVCTISVDNVYKYCAREINLRCSILIIDLLASLGQLGEPFFPG